MKKFINSNTSFILSLILVSLLLFAFCELGFCSRDYEFIKMKRTLGGFKGTQNSAEIESIAKFAVQEHNKKENSLLEFTRVVNAKEQVVAGKIYHLTLEAIDTGKKKFYEAKVWVKPWMNFKQLQEFKHANDVPLFTSSDLGVKRDGHGPGWQTVSTDDPLVQDAAHYAVQSIQRASNSLAPHELLEILLAKAKVNENYVNLDLLLKSRRGTKEAKFKVLVNKNIEGKFHLCHMEQYHY